MTGMTDPKVRAVVDRAFPNPGLRMTRAETEAEGQENPPRPTLNLQMCPGVGKVGIERDGVLVCPECGDPVADGCGSSRYKRKANR